MSNTSEYKKFYKILKRKVSSSVGKKSKSAASKGSIHKKTPSKPSQDTTSQDPLQDDVFAGPITHINVILENTSSESEDEVVDLVKCEYCLKKFATRNKLYVHKLCHLSVSVEKLILPTLEDSIVESVSTHNNKLEMTVLNQCGPTGQYLQNDPSLQPVPTLQTLPQIPNVKLFVQHSMPAVAQMQQVLQHNVPMLQQLQHSIPHLQQVAQRNIPHLQLVPQLQLPVPPMQPLQNLQQAAPPNKKKLIELNGLTFGEWNENNTLDDTNMIHEEVMLPSDIKEEIKIEPQKLDNTNNDNVDNLNLQQPATVATSGNEVDPLAIDEPTIPVAINNQIPLVINQQAVPMVGNINQTINQQNLNFPLQLSQLIAIPMQNGQILIAGPLPSTVNNLNSAPQNLLVPLGNIVTGAQLPNFATPQLSTQLPIVVNHNSLLSLNNVTQEQQLTINNIATQENAQLQTVDVATRQQNLLLPVQQQDLPLPINSVVNNSTKEENILEEEREIDFTEKELNSLIEKQGEKNKKQEKVIKRKLLKETNSKKEKKDLSDILKETAFALNDVMVGAKQRRRRRPGVPPREIRKGEIQKKKLAEKAKQANTCTEKTVTANDGATKTCAVKTVPVEKVIASIDLTDTDGPQKNISLYTPSSAFLRPGPSYIPGSAKLPGSWDLKPKNNATSGFSNKTTNISQETAGLNVSEMPLKTNFLEALLNQKSRPPDSFDKIHANKNNCKMKRNRGTVSVNTVTSNTEPLENMTLKDMVEKKVPTKTATSKDVPVNTVSPKVTSQVNSLRKNKAPPKTTSLWQNMTLKDMIETGEPSKKVPWETETLKDIVQKSVPSKNVTPETSSQKTMVGNIDKTQINVPYNINEIPLRYDKLIESSKLRCMYCKRFSANWHSLISHMRQHLKVTLTRIEKCVICTKRYCTKEGSKLCCECGPFHREVQDKYDLTYNRQRENLKFVKLHKDLVEPECILEDTYSNCVLEDPLGTICTKEEPLEDICTKMVGENQSCTNIDSFKSYFHIENNPTKINCEEKNPMEQSICTNLDTINENVTMKSMDDNEPGTNIDSCADNDSSSSIDPEEDTCTNIDPEENDFCTNIDSDENDSGTNIDPEDKNTSKNINFEENYTCMNIDCFEDEDSCTNVVQDVCTKKDSGTKKNPFHENDATLLQYCEPCYKFGLKFTDCGILNHVYRYKCVDEIKYSNKFLECNKCGGKFTSVKCVVRFIARRKKYIKVIKPAYNILNMMQLQNRMTMLMNSRK